MVYMLPCPACRKKVSEEATICPKCGHPLAEDEGFQAQREALHKPASSVAIGIAILFVLSLPAYFYYRHTATDEDVSPSASKAAAAGDVHGAWAYMQMFVQKRLKSPSSADFPFGGYRHVTPLGGGRYKVDSYVDSQNSFRAVLRTRFEGVIKRSAGGWELESLRLKG